jgi:hypothetical protein
MIDPTRDALTETRNALVADVANAELWLAYKRAAVAWYDQWLADPDLAPPDREFPDYKPVIDA